jgi:Protein of unknown function (DUF3347)
MKTKSILFSLLFAVSVFTFFNCGGNKQEESSHDQTANQELIPDSAAANETVVAPQFTVDVTFQHQLAGVFNTYVILKEAFVSSNVAGVSTQATATRKILDGTDMKLLSGAAHNDWMNYLNGMEASLETMQSSSDIEVQRQAFSILSENLYKSIKAYGLGGGTAYYEFCPMAFNNQGAFWLSDAEEIRNPYFGDKMLTCGSVTEKLR